MKKNELLNKKSSLGLAIIILTYVLNFLFTVLTARYLSLSDFGIFSVVNYLFALVGLAFYGFHNIALTSKHGDNLSDLAKYQKIEVLRKKPLLLIILCMLLCATTSWIGFGDRSLPYLSLLIITPITFVLSLYFGLATSVGLINIILILSLISSSLRILTICLQKLLQLDVNLFLFILALIPYLIFLIIRNRLINFRDFFVTKEMNVGLGLSLLGFVFWVGTSLDVILVRFVFDSEDSGLYMLSATIGRSVLFVYLYFVQYEYPMMSTRGSHFSTNILYKKGITILFASAGIILLLGDQIIRLAFNKDSTSFTIFTAIYIISLLPLVYVLPQIQLLTIQKKFGLTGFFSGIILFSITALVLWAETNWESVLISFCTNTMFAVLIWLSHSKNVDGIKIWRDSNG